MSAAFSVSSKMILSETLYTAFWNFCSPLDQTSEKECSGPQLASVLEHRSQKCLLLADEVEIRATGKPGVQNPQFYYTNANSSTNGGISQLMVDMICNETAVEEVYGLLIREGTAFQTSMQSKLACPIFTFNAVWQFVAAFRYLFGAILLICGGFLALSGRKSLSLSIFVAATMFSTVIIFALLSLFL